MRWLFAALFLAPALCLAQADYVRLRKVWPDKRVSEFDDDSSDRDAALYSITGRPFKDIVETALPRAAIARAR